ncbi:MAG: Flp family type IVb pilin [Rhizomicrobium sp.]|jgi:Flp pilus assembly pilin Flp
MNSLLTRFVRHESDAKDIIHSLIAALVVVVIIGALHATGALQTTGAKLSTTWINPVLIYSAP